MPDSTSQTKPIQIPPLTGIYAEPFSAGKMLRMMKFFGPAAVVASLSLGVGETIMVTGLGAWSEYGLFWLLILSVLVKGIFVTYLIGRYTAITGQRIGQRLVMLPGPRGWLLLAVIVAELGLIGMGLTAVAKPCRAAVPGTRSGASFGWSRCDGSTRSPTRTMEIAGVNSLAPNHSRKLRWKCGGGGMREGGCANASLRANTKRC